MCEEENKETSKIQNQTNKNNNNQQKTPSNNKEQKLNSEEVQREVQTSRNNAGNAPSSTASLSSMNDTTSSKVFKKQTDKQQTIDKLQKQNYQYIVQNAQQQINQIQVQPKQQINPKRIASNQDQPILIESPKSDDLHKEDTLQQISVQKLLQQQQQQQQQQIINQNAMKLINMLQIPEIGISSQDIQKQIQLTNSQKPLMLDHIQKLEEISMSGDQSKSYQNVVLSDKEIQNIERKRIQKEQSLEQRQDFSIQYFEDYMSAQGQNIRFGSSQDLSSKQKQNLNNSTSGSNQGSSKKSQQNPQVNNIIVKTLKNFGQSETVQIQFEQPSENSLKRKIIEQNNSNSSEGLSKKRIYEKITNIGKEDNPITIDD